MKDSLILLLLLVVLTVWAEVHLPPGVDRRMYCETCLATVQELKKMKELARESGKAKVRGELSKVCKSLPQDAENNASDEKKAITACKHLLETHGDKFVDVLLLEKEETLEANLCYLHTMACTGVKRKSFEVKEEQHKFEDGVKEFLETHANKVRRVNPTMPQSDGSLRKEEL